MDILFQTFEASVMVSVWIPLAALCVAALALYFTQRGEGTKHRIRRERDIFLGKKKVEFTYSYYRILCRLQSSIEHLTKLASGRGYKYGHGLLSEMLTKNPSFVKLDTILQQNGVKLGIIPSSTGYVVGALISIKAETEMFTKQYIAPDGDFLGSPLDNHILTSLEQREIISKLCKMTQTYIFKAIRGMEGVYSEMHSLLDVNGVYKPSNGSHIVSEEKAALVELERVHADMLELIDRAKEMYDVSID